MKRHCNQHWKSSTRPSIPPVAAQNRVHLILILTALYSADWVGASVESRPYLPVIGPSALRFEMFARPTIAMSMLKPSRPDSSGKAETKVAEKPKSRSKSTHPALGEASSPVLPAATANLLDPIEEPLFSSPGMLFGPDYDSLRPRVSGSRATLELTGPGDVGEVIENVIPAQEKSAPAIPTRAFIHFFDKTNKLAPSTNRNTTGVSVAIPFNFEPPTGNDPAPSSSAEFKKE